ncbi:MAG: CoA transferase, partial [Acidimicrobiales bacterium]
VGNPIHMSATPTKPAVVAPSLGQHTEEVLLEAGFSWEEIDHLRAEGAY